MILLALNIYISNLEYLKNKVFHIIELLDSSTKGFDFGLDYAAAILDNVDQFLPDLNDLRVEKAKK